MVAVVSSISPILTSGFFSRYYHRVKSTNRNFAVSFLFGTMSEFDMAGCDAPTLPLPLEEAHVLWKYPGQGVMSMGNSDPDDVKEMLIDALRVGIIRHL